MRYQEKRIVSHGKYTSLAALDHPRSDSGKPLLPGSSRSISLLPGPAITLIIGGITIRKDNRLARRRQLCQDMGRMAWPDEAQSARDEIIAIDEELAGGKDET